jgi:hypothetical protein
VTDNPAYSDVFSYLTLSDPTLEGAVGFIRKYKSDDPFSSIGIAAMGNWMRIVNLAHLFAVIEPSLSPWERAADPDGTEASARLHALIQTMRPLDQSRDSLGGALMIAAWTAVETASTDLWVAVANKKPKTIGLKVAKSPNQDIKPGKQPLYESGKSIKLTALEKYGLDLREHMGDVLGERFHFGILDGLKDAYRQAFGKESPIAKIFDDQDLGALHAFRNILVHRGGCVDATFTSRICSHPDFKKLGEQVYLEVNPALTLRMIQCAGRSLSTLFGQVDSWMGANPGP